MRTALRATAAFSDAGWETRKALAACYRLLHRFRMTDTINTHIAARVPGAEDRFLINRYGLLFNEITASNLLAVDWEGNPLAQDKAGANPAGFAIHRAMFKARTDIACSLHTHTKAGVTLSTLKCGLLPLTQFSFIFHGHVGYNDYKHVTGAHDDCDGMGRDLGKNYALVLRNHGLLTVGRTIPEAFLLMYYLEKAADVQIAAMACGAELVQPPMSEVEGMSREVEDGFGGMPFGEREWTALVRELDRDDPSYAS
jgi:ribulose-5-phosphate 4-epimerase/fuculose-1-phosphate aldolase